MGGMLEREIKLRFDGGRAARDAVLAIGGVPLRPRRLQSDAILDRDGGDLRDARCALRLRIEAGRAILTFKGPPQPSSMKLREELETPVEDSALLLDIFERLGFTVCFRYEKYREEFAVADAVVAVDETPVGTFIEIEGTAAGIHAVATALGRGPSDYVVASYRALFVQHCAERGVEPTHMLFAAR